MRWGWIKKEFTKAWLEIGGTEQPCRVRCADHSVSDPRTSPDTLGFVRSAQRTLRCSLIARACRRAAELTTAPPQWHSL